MNKIYAGIIVEAEKLLYKKKTIALIIGLVAICLLAAAALAAGQHLLGVTAVNSTRFPLLYLYLLVNFFLPLMVFSMAADMFAGEVGDKTLKLALVRPVSRFKTYVGKNLALACFIAGSLALALITSWLFGSILTGGGEFFDSFIKTGKAYLLAVVPVTVLAFYAAFVSQFFKSSSSAILACLLTFLLAKIIGLMYPDISGLLFTGYLDWHLLWLSDTVQLSRLLSIGGLFLSGNLIFFTLGYYLFDKKEL